LASRCLSVGILAILSRGVGRAGGLRVLRAEAGSNEARVAERRQGWASGIAQVIDKKQKKKLIDL
jgi:hypothetical protein